MYVRALCKDILLYARLARALTYLMRIMPDLYRLKNRYCHANIFTAHVRRPRNVTYVELDQFYWNILVRRE